MLDSVPLELVCFYFDVGVLVYGGEMAWVSVRGREWYGAD